VVGGYRTLWGPPLGAVVYFVVKDFLGDFANHWMGIFGVTLIAVVAFAPDGVAGALVRLAPWRAPDRGSPAKSRFPVSATPR
jgi:branched-chain amino acid transport system permease protein